MTELLMEALNKSYYRGGSTHFSVCAEGAGCFVPVAYTTHTEVWATLKLFCTTVIHLALPEITLLKP